MTVLSNSDALLVAVPMIGLLVICHFRLDELVGKPRTSRKPSLCGRPFAETEDGRELSLQARAGGRGCERRELEGMRRPRVRAEVD